MGIPTVATGYMLLGDPPLTAAAYISHSLPIPMHKPELAVATAQAGCLLGMQCIFMDAGSGAGTPISTAVISAVREAVDAPIVVGRHDLPNRFGSRLGGRCHCCVVGTAIEKDPKSSIAWPPMPLESDRKGDKPMPSRLRVHVVFCRF